MRVARPVLALERLEARTLVGGEAGTLAGVLWYDITEDGPMTLVGGAVAFDAFSMAAVAIRVTRASQSLPS